MTDKPQTTTERKQAEFDAMSNIDAPPYATFLGKKMQRIKPVGNEATGEFYELTINGWNYVRI